MLAVIPNSTLLLTLAKLLMILGSQRIMKWAFRPDMDRPTSRGGGSVNPFASPSIHLADSTEPDVQLSCSQDGNPTAKLVAEVVSTASPPKASSLRRR
jgi:hypothetical protein